MGGRRVKLTADTNVLVRSVIGDDPEQAAIAARILKEASLIAVSTACLCEFVWVLRRFYKVENTDCSAAIRALLETRNVVMNRPAVEAGLAILDEGGDFADGIMAYEGEWLGAEIFVSFDKSAVDRLQRRGKSAQCLGSR